MLQSMTGFGDAKWEMDGYSFLVEIKSLNNRFLKTSIRLPDALNSLEPEIERIIRKTVSRGSVNYALHMRNMSEEGAFDVNHAAVEKYVLNLNQIATLHSQNKGMTIDLATLLQLPGVCQLRTFSPEELEKFLDIVEKLTRDALKDLQAMRAQEGEALLQDLQENCDVIRRSLSDLKELSGEVVNHYRRRIQEQVNTMLAEAKLSLNEDQLLKEVALFAERSDINEEMSRLEAHLTHFNKACETGEQSGRRLDFISQEMFREANTIASKSNDARISHHVVDMKVAIDRLREQIQNIE